MERQPTPPQGRVYPWVIASVFGLVILAVMLLAFLRPLQVDRPSGDGQTAEEGAAQAALNLVPAGAYDCYTLVQQAMQTSDQECQSIGRNEVCYGNYTVDAQLATGSAEQFNNRGDVIPVDILQSLFAAPLDLSGEEWGVAVFKLQATLPSTVPGQNVTFLVFGDTSLENQSGDMQAFYFSTGFGQVECEAVPLDGIIVDMPDGTGVTFQANDTELTIMGGTTVMEATPDEDMTVTMLRGDGLISANGVRQFFGAGSAVSVPLGGDDGLGADGPPSEPVSVPTVKLGLGCAVTGVGCDPEDIVVVQPEEAQARVEAAINGEAVAETGGAESGSSAVSVAGSTADGDTGGATGGGTGGTGGGDTDGTSGGNISSPAGGGTGGTGSGDTGGTDGGEIAITTGGSGTDGDDTGGRIGIALGGETEDGSAVAEAGPFGATSPILRVAAVAGVAVAAVAALGVAVATVVALRADNPAESLPDSADRTWRIRLTGLKSDRQSLTVEISEDAVIGRFLLGEAKPAIDLTEFDEDNLVISRQHAILKPAPDGLFLADLGSRNGTFLNGNPVSRFEPQRVNDNDTVAFGELQFKLNILRAPGKSAA